MYTSSTVMSQIIHHSRCSAFLFLHRAIHAHIGREQRAAQKISNISGGKLDCLIHNAARMSADTLYKDFDSLLVSFLFNDVELQTDVDAARAWTSSTQTSSTQ